jgi:hypothetical protein
MNDEIEFSPDSLLQRNNDIMTAEMGEELVMLHLDRSSYFGMDEIGREIWAQLQNSISLADLCAALQKEFDVDAETCLQDTEHFLRRLARNDLLTVDGKTLA